MSRRYARWRALGVGLAFTGLASAGVETPETAATHLTLRGCVETAVKQATAVLKAKQDREFTGEQLLQTYAQFLPNLSIVANYALMRGTAYYSFTAPTSVKTDSVGLTYTITSTLNLFNGLSDLAGLKSALARNHAAESTLTRAKQQIALDIAQAYLQVILDEELVRIAERNLALSKERERLLAAQAKVGSRNLADLFRQQAATATDTSTWVNAQTKARNDRIALIQRLRFDVTKDYSLEAFEKVEPQLDPRFAEEDKLLEQGYQNRADLTAASERVSSAEWDVTQARSGFLPKLDLGVGVYSSGRTLWTQVVNGQSVIPATQPSLWDQINDQIYWTGGVTLTWNIFDRFITRQNVSNAQVAAEKNRIDLYDRRLAIAAEVRQSLGEYRAVFEQAEAARRGLEAAEKAYEVVQGKYEVGSANFIDLTAAQAALVQAEAARVQTRIDFRLKARQIEFAAGTLPETFE